MIFQYNPPSQEFPAERKNSCAIIPHFARSFCIPPQILHSRKKYFRENTAQEIAQIEGEIDSISEQKLHA